MRFRWTNNWTYYEKRKYICQAVTDIQLIGHLDLYQEQYTLCQINIRHIVQWILNISVQFSISKITLVPFCCISKYNIHALLDKLELRKLRFQANTNFWTPQILLGTRCSGATTLLTSCCLSPCHLYSTAAMAKCHMQV